MSCFTALTLNPALAAVIALTYLFIHCNFVACCWLFCAYSDEPELTTTAPITTTTTGEATTTAGTDMRSVLLLASFVLRTKIYYRRRTARRDVSDKTLLTATSHARTVVRECCKGDDESQWERGKFDPPPPKNPLTDGHQNLCR